MINAVVGMDPQNHGNLIGKNVTHSVELVSLITYSKH